MRGSAGGYRLWTATDDERLRTLCCNGIVGEPAWNLIAEEFPGRSGVSCRQRWLVLRNQAAGIKGPQRKYASRAVKGRIRRRIRDDLTAAVVAQARAPDHTDLTAAIMGDPRPGRSALDLIRTAVAAPPAISLPTSAFSTRSSKPKGDSHASHH